MNTTYPRRAQRVVILGCGYVGTALGQQLAARGHHVVGTTRTPGRCVEIEATGLEARVFTVEDVDAMHVLLAQCDVIYMTLSAGRHDRNYRDVYLHAARLLVSALPHTAIRRVIYTSSTGVYAQNDGSWVDETSATKPENENAKSLVETEQTLLAATVDEERTGTLSQKVAVSIVRLAGIYGPGRNLARRALQSAGQQRGDGNVWVNLIHLEDIVTALSRLVDVEHHGVLNLTGDVPLRRRELYDAMLASARAKQIDWYDDPNVGQGKRVSNRLIKQSLGLTLKHAGALKNP